MKRREERENTKELNIIKKIKIKKLFFNLYIS